MATEVQGVVAMTKGEPVSLVTIVVPDPGPGEAVVAFRHAACVIRICTTEKEGSTTSFLFCSDMRRRGS